MLPKSDYIIAERGYDSEALRDKIRDKGAIPVIPRKKNSKVGNDDTGGEAGFVFNTPLIDDTLGLRIAFNYLD